ncbi:hypothetical protein B0H14DRAFT_2639459 [Mycena olivaceomarginata]|nr:hypothetical protein B0H14DRAFT_2639459 [Mycena olivaceomarginata]
MSSSPFRFDAGEMLTGMGSVGGVLEDLKRWNVGGRRTLSNMRLALPSAAKSNRHKHGVDVHHPDMEEPNRPSEAITVAAVTPCPSPLARITSHFAHAQATLHRHKPFWPAQATWPQAKSKPHAGKAQNVAGKCKRHQLYPLTSEIISIYFLIASQHKPFRRAEWLGNSLRHVTQATLPKPHARPSQIHGHCSIIVDLWRGPETIQDDPKLKYCTTSELLVDFLIGLVVPGNSGVESGISALTFEIAKKKCTPGKGMFSQ